MRTRLFAIGISLLSVSASADVGPPPRNDCHLLAPGSPCWTDGKRAGACQEKTPGGAVVCVAGAAPTRAMASAKPAASADAAPAPTWCSIGYAGRDPSAARLLAFGLVVLLGLWRRRWSQLQ